MISTEIGKYSEFNLNEIHPDYTEELGLTAVLTSDWHMKHKSGNTKHDWRFDSGRGMVAVEAILSVPNLDVVFHMGDFTDHGVVDEARSIARCLRRVTDKGIALIGVLGNHDYIAGKERQIACMLEHDAGAVLLPQAEPVELVEGELVVVGMSGYAKNTRKGETEMDVLKEGLSVMRQKGLRGIGIIHQHPPTNLLPNGKIPRCPDACRDFRNMIDKNADIVDYIVYGHAHGLKYDAPLRGVTEAGVPFFNVAMPSLIKEAKSNCVIPDFDPFKTFIVVHS